MQPDREQRTAQLIPAIRRGDRQALSEAVEIHMPLVHAMLRRAGRGLDTGEAIQNGCVGLILALKKFEPERGFSFSTYAVPYILGEMKKPRRQGGAVHIPRSLKEEMLALERLREALCRQQGREISLQQLAQHAGISPEEAAFLLGGLQAVRSLDEPGPAQQEPLAQSLRSARNTQEEAMRRLLIRQAFSQLEPREKKLLYLRYFQDHTQQQTAQLLHISQVQVSRLEKRILEKLRRHFRDAI